MFDDFFVFACFIGIAFFFYKWFELLILKKERMEALSRLEGDNLLEYTKRMPIGLGGGSSVAQQKPSHPAAWPLRWGLLLLGIGLGFSLDGLRLSIRNLILMTRNLFVELWF